MRWVKIAGTNEDEDMSSKARDTGSRSYPGEGDLLSRG